MYKIRLCIATILKKKKKRKKSDVKDITNFNDVSPIKKYIYIYIKDVKFVIYLAFFIQNKPKHPPICVGFCR